MVFRAFINLFMVPVITLVLLSKNRRIELKPCFDLLIYYAMVVVANVPFTSVLTFIIRVLVGIEIDVDSRYYNLCAIFAAVIIEICWEGYLQKKDEVHASEKQIEKGFEK